MDIEEKYIEFNLNSKGKIYKGDLNISLLNYLRMEGITSVKDGCSGQAACGACMVEIDGKAVLSCVTKMKKLNGAKVVTIEGFPAELKDYLAKAFVSKGAVQCGFCSPGFLTRTKILLENNPNANRDEIIKALKFNVCRCTGYIKIIEAIEVARDSIINKTKIDLNKVAGIGKKYPKYRAYEKAIGTNPFVDDLKFDNLLYGALKFSAHPRAKVLSIDVTEAEKSSGVVRVFTAKDIPGKRFTGLIKKDWPVMVDIGEITRYIGDVLAGVVADTEENARKAIGLINVEYEVLEPLTDMLKAEKSSIIIDESGNLLEDIIVKRGEQIEQVLKNSDFVSNGIYKTQRIEHAFLETETAVALPWGHGIELFSQGQGVYEDRKSIALILNLPEKDVKVTLIPNGGGFGGKEDLTVQGHVSIFAYILKKPVKLHLSREESIRMHPKRHPFYMEFSLGCNKNGMLTGVKAKIIGDTGAYASVGMKVLERAAGHATGAYNIPNVDLSAKAFYTNNIPCGAMRGFGVNQVTFAIEGCIDELCEKGGFDRWQFRYDNALINGSKTATGQILRDAVGVRKTLEAVKEQFYKTKYAGLACGIKNCGVGNGMADFSEVKIHIVSKNEVIIHHGWTEMGQGVNTIAIQTLFEETGIDPAIIKVKVSTENEAKSGMTTSSRGTSLVGNAVIKAAKELKKDLKNNKIDGLSGKTYFGRWSFDNSTKPGAEGEVITHYSYSYASQLVSLDDNGKIDTVYAAHDAGKIMNKTLFEGQIEGAIHMGLGYTLSEDLPMEKGFLKSTKYRDLGLLSIKDMPKVVVIGVEEEDPLGPYGAKGVGEIGLVPTAGAVCNALYQFDKKRRYVLPVKKNNC